MRNGRYTDYYDTIRLPFRAIKQNGKPQFGNWPTSMKLSVSFRFTRPQTFGRIPWTGDQLLSRPLPVYKHRKTRAHTQTPNKHALSGIRTHDPGFRASEDSACLKPRAIDTRLRPVGYRERQTHINFIIKQYNLNTRYFSL
jgi:hypothetical protein